MTASWFHWRKRNPPAGTVPAGGTRKHEVLFLPWMTGGLLTKKGKSADIFIHPMKFKNISGFPWHLRAAPQGWGGLSASSDLGCRLDAGKILLSEVRFSVRLLRCGRQQHRRGSRLRAYPEQRSAAPQANRPSCKRCAGQQQEPIRRDPQAPKKRVRAPEGISVLQSGKALNGDWRPAFRRFYLCVSVWRRS